MDNPASETNDPSPKLTIASEEETTVVPDSMADTTPPQEKKALTEESQKENKEGEKEVLTPPQVSAPFPRRLKNKSED